MCLFHVIIYFLFKNFFLRVVVVKTSDWKTIIEADYPKAAQLAFSSKGTYLMVYEPFMSKYKIKCSRKSNINFDL